MSFKKPWRVAGLLAIGVLVGSVIGPPIVQAATSLVTIQGAGSTHKAKVDSTGRLLVNSKGTTKITGVGSTKASQLLTTEAGAAAAVVVFNGPSCAAGGIYTIPAGKALIITGVNFYNHAAGAGDHELILLTGPAASPCSSLVAAGIQTDVDVSQNQSFHPGIPVPAGGAVGLSAFNDNGTVELYGYLVPAAAVPPIVSRKAPRVHGGQSPTTSATH
jgi:hypothetical protein